MNFRLFSTLVLTLALQSLFAQTEPRRTVLAGSEIIAQISTTPCLGDCPVFEATLYSDGLASYHGRANVENIGFFQTQVDLSIFNQLLQLVNQSGIMQMNDSYPASESNFIVDGSNTIVFVRRGNEEKQVVHNHGGPESLVTFQKELTALFEELPWVKVN